MKKYFVFFLLVAQSAIAAQVQFDDLKENSSLDGWEAGWSGSGKANWVVHSDPKAPSKPNLLTQTGVATSTWLTKKGSKIKNGFVEAEMNVMSGKDDPEAGLVFRQQDKDNFYYVRANTLKQNLVFYRMKKGQKETIKTADVSIPQNTWHRLKIEFKDDTFNVSFDGNLVISARDGVFTSAGKIGFFTTADTKPGFDNLSFDGVP